VFVLLGGAPDVSFTTSTSVLVIEGDLACEDNLSAVNDIEVTITSLHTGQTIYDTTGRTAGDGRFTTFLNLLGDQFGVGDAFELRVVDPSGTFSWARPIRYQLTADDVRRSRLSLNSILLNVIPDKTALMANYPNPFNPETWIPFQLSADAAVKVGIYNAAGERVRSLDLGWLPAGTYSSRMKAAHWDGRSEMGERVASGLYFYCLEAGSFAETHRMIMAK
jgi:hypothetical protein